MKKIVTVIGLGYVGLPLACAIAKSNKYKIFGLTRNSKTALEVNNKISPIKDEFSRIEIKKVNLIALTEPKDCLPYSDYIIVCVPTPVHHNFLPDLRPVIDTTKLIAKYLKRGQTIIIESTIYPGTCEEIILPILEKTELMGGKDFDLSHCPERINPADPRWNVYNISRNVGSLTKKGCRKTIQFYRSFLKAEIFEMTTLKEAESTKIVENAFRDVNIAFVNELAMSFDKMGINLINVLKGAANKPFAFLSHFPGCGVGGHCIAVDPYYLIERAKHFGFVHHLLKQARKINNYMPKYTARLLMDMLNKSNIKLGRMKIGILGVSYKPDVADIRTSPAISVINLLTKKGIPVEIYDPYVEKLSTVTNLESLLEKCKILILCTNHRLFEQTLTASKFKQHKIQIIIDGRNCLNQKEIQKQGIYYKGIGR